MNIYIAYFIDEFYLSVNSIRGPSSSCSRRGSENRTGSGSVRNSTTSSSSRSVSGSGSGRGSRSCSITSQEMIQ